MDQTTKILLKEDPAAFMDAVRNHSAEVRFNKLRTFDDIMTCEILRHGIFNDFSKLPDLVRLYNELFFPAPVARRKEIYGHVTTIVSSLGGWTAPALSPFMLLDDDMGIVSTATIDYASLGSLIDDDPMSRPRDVVDMITKDLPRNPAAVVGGLLALGDPRVCALLAPLRDKLDGSQVEIVTKCFSGFTAKCVVNFYLDWLGELVDRQDYDGLRLFGKVAAGLYRLADRRTVPFITDGLRPFPVPGTENAEGWSSIRRIDPDVFASSIADRLYNIEQREGAPKVIAHAIRAFGLTPKTPPGDTECRH